MEPGCLVKVLFDFTPDNDQELALQVGDIVLVTERLNKQWCRGRSNGGREGNFPSGFATQLQVPNLEDGQELFAAVNDFVAQQPGDLSFRKGELIVGLVAIDSNWWKGEVNGERGIFPATYAWKIDRNLLPKKNGPKKVSFKARVKRDMTAQIDGEMDLREGDIVHITEEIDKDWYRGECNGRTGMFPASFVTLLENGSVLPEASCETQISTNHNPEIVLDGPAWKDSNQYGYDCINSGIAAYCRTLHPFKAECSNELSFSAGEIVNILRHVDENWLEGELDGRIGMFPKNHVNIIVDCPVENKPQSSKDFQAVVYPDTYGRVLFDFDPQSETEAKLSEGDTVTLIRNINEEWVEVATDSGSRCTCPSSYLEIIETPPDLLPPSYSDVMGSGLNAAFFVPVHGVNSSDANKSFCNERPLSYPSSSFDRHNSSLNSSTGNEHSFKASQSIDAKIAENLSFLDSGISSESSQDSSQRSSLKSSSFISDHNASSVLDRSDISSNLGASPVPFLMQLNGSMNDSSYCNLFGMKEPSPWDIEEEPEKPAASKAPVRPPLPASVRSQPVGAVPNGNCSGVGPNSSLTANELKQKISEKESEMRRLLAARSKLESEKRKSQNEESVKKYFQFDVATFSKEIQGLDVEITALKNDLHRIEGMPSSTSTNIASVLTSETGEASANREAVVAERREGEERRRAEERKKKMEEQRSCVITEILQTEKDYLSDLKILRDVFLRNQEEGKAKGVDMVTLFGNLEDVIDVASRLLKRLDKTVKCSSDPMIGECFVKMAEEMKETYGHYCRNHDDVNAVLEKYEDKSAAGQYLRHKVELLKRQTNCFDLPSMLIKPVQRILKYPLLLNELVKCTDDGHPDKQCLLKAIEQMTDVATAINEFKRRQDLVFKYRKHADTSLSGRISKFSFHSMLKKGSRFGMRLSNTIGLTSVIKDENFEKLEREFRALEKMVKILIKDVTAHIEKMEELVKTAFSVAEDIAEFYGERKNQQEVDRFRSVHRMIVTQFFEDNKQVLERNVISILKDLLQTFHGPNFLIQKRYDKLLDYEACTNKMEKNKDATKIKTLQDNQHVAKSTYEALNMQLLDDLPKFYSTSVEIIRDCIQYFLKAKRNFIGNCAREMLSLAELPLLIGSQVGGEGASGIIGTFQVKHTLVTDGLYRMSIVPKQLFPTGGSSTLRKSSSPSIGRVSFGTSSQLGKQPEQSASQKAYIKSNYSSAQLYTASEDFEAVDVLDLTLKKGDVVGVLKQQNAMGNKLKWFVDNGAAKGFVPSKVLIKVLSDFSPTSPTQPFAPGQTQHLSFRKGSASAALPTYSIIPRNTQTRRSLPSAAVERKKSEENSDYDNCRKSNTAPRPVRPAPPPYEQVDSSRPTAAPAPPPPTMAVGNLAVVSPQSNSVCAVPTSVNQLAREPSETEPHRYEEINEFFDRYDVVADESLAGTANQSNISKVSLQEFDPYAPVRQPMTLYDNVPSDEQRSGESYRYEVIDEGNDAEGSDDSEYYYALYDFIPTGSNQLKLSKGQVVLVLHKCDLNQNSEWWFVEDRHGHKGYVPANYLYVYPKVANNSNS